jgi:hypothetical protein
MRAFSRLVFAYVILASLPASADSLTRLWVSGKGVDRPDCGALASPCRQIKYALDNNLVSAGGEIDVLDPAGFAPFWIKFKVSIINDGVGAASVQQMAAGGASAITISIGANDTVYLRGFSLEGANVFSDGVNIGSLGAVVIERFVVQNFQAGVTRSVLSGVSTLTVADSTFVGNDTGVFIQGIGIGTGNAYGLVRNSSFVKNSTGIRANASGGNAAVTIDNCAAHQNGTGNAATGSPQSSVRLSRSLATDNTSGISLSNGAVALSFGDNRIYGNLLDVDPPGAIPVISTR